MPRLRDLNVYPYASWPGSPWHENADVDLAARVSAMVTAALAVGLRQVELRADSSQLRLFAEVGDSPELVVTVLTDPVREGFEAGHLQVPAGFGELRPDVAATALADAWRVALVELGRVREFDEGQVDELIAVAHPTVPPGWFGPWKLAPGRRRRARLAARMEHDGFSRQWVEFADPGAQSDFATDEIVGPCGLPPQLRGFDPLTWADATTVRFGRGLPIPTATDGRRRVRQTFLVPAMGRKPLLLRGTRTDPPTVQYLPPPSFTVGGGYGPTTRRLSAYLDAAGALDEQFQTPAWQDWWRAIGVDDVFAPIWFTGDTAKIVVRRTGAKLSAVRYRPPRTVPTSAPAARALARADADALIDRVRTKFDLSEPPAFAE